MPLFDASFDILIISISPPIPEISGLNISAAFLFINSLKWKVRTNMNEGLSETIDWYKNNYKYFSKFNKRDIHKRLGIKK